MKRFRKLSTNTSVQKFAKNYFLLDQHQTLLGDFKVRGNTFLIKNLECLIFYFSSSLKKTRNEDIYYANMFFRKIRH